MTPPFLGLNLTRGGVGICMRPLAQAIDDGLLQLQQTCSLRDFHFRQCPLLLFSPRIVVQHVYYISAFQVDWKGNRFIFRAEISPWFAIESERTHLLPD